jgi:hypothetical protein
VATSQTRLHGASFQYQRVNQKTLDKGSKEFLVLQTRGWVIHETSVHEILLVLNIFGTNDSLSHYPVIRLITLTTLLPPAIPPPQLLLLHTDELRKRGTEMTLSLPRHTPHHSHNTSTTGHTPLSYSRCTPMSSENQELQ